MTVNEAGQRAGAAVANHSEAASRRLVAAFAAFVLTLVPTLVHAAPADQPVFTDFEGLTTSLGVPFEIGPSGSRVEFGGNARATNVGGNALSGTQAWVVQDAAAPGTITFIDEPATEVEFYATPGSNPFGMVIRAFDPDGGLIGSPIVLNAGTGWTLVSFTEPVDRILVVNDAVGDLVYIDDFGFSTGSGPAVPLLGTPGILALLVMMMLGGGRFVRRRKLA